MVELLAKPVAEVIRARVFERVAKFVERESRKPKLVVVLVGEDPASVIYTKKKGEVAQQLGMDHETIHFPITAKPDDVQTCVQQLNADPTVDGILIQRPLPPDFDEEKVLYWVAPEKDVDAFHPENAGRLFLGLPSFQPCTPAGIMKILRHYQIQIEGKTACVVGRSSIVGKPMASLLLQANATLIQCHRQTKDLASFTRLADILIVAAGKPRLIGRQHVRPGATVIDVGVHRDSNGKIMGDVLFDEVAGVASAISPVPGGVGPMTISILMENTIYAAETRAQLN